jgi:hypothetical protein
MSTLALKACWPSRCEPAADRPRPGPAGPGACKVDLDRVADHPLYESAEVPRRELPAEVVAVALHDAGREGRRRRGLLRREEAAPAPSADANEPQQASRSPGERAPEGHQGHGRHALFTNVDRLTCDIVRYPRTWRACRCRYCAGLGDLRRVPGWPASPQVERACGARPSGAAGAPDPGPRLWRGRI